MIRKATPDDMHHVMRMAFEFWRVSGATHIDFDPYTVEQTANFLMTGTHTTLLLADEGGPCGMTGAMLHPAYLNAAHMSGQELFWWVDEDKRGGRVGVEMYDALEAWVRDMGASSFTMIALDAQSPEIVGKFYERRGYRPLERHYTKVF